MYVQYFFSPFDCIFGNETLLIELESLHSCVWFCILSVGAILIDILSHIVCDGYCLFTI